MTSIRTIIAALSALLVGAVACGSSGSSPSGPNDGNVYIDGFDPGPVPDGYTRYVTPIIKDIAPGTDKMWCQYVSQKPFDQDYDVVDLTGSQSKGGHHVVFYAVKNSAPYGTTHDCSDSDMTRLIYLGAIGGEGTAGIAKAQPQGTVFRVPAGYSIMANVHFINVTNHNIDGQAAVDLKVAPADPKNTTMTIFTNVATDDKLLVPAHSPAKLDLNCTVKQDLDILMFANHLHERGSMAFTEVVHADNSKTMLRQDMTWTPHNTFDPPFTSWTVDAPMHLKAGDVVHTHCEWNNTTDQTFRFPTEMCVGVGFYKGLVEIDCVDGDWTQ